MRFKLIQIKELTCGLNFKQVNPASNRTDKRDKQKSHTH